MKNHVLSTYSFDHFAFLFFIFAVLLTFFFELLIVCPSIQDNLYFQIAHWILGCYLLHNVLGNFFMIVKKETSIKGILLPSKLNSDWRYCLSCEYNSPPRSYHCMKCNICILKRDHHCLFACKCIGYFNFRYFIALLFYISIGSIYSSILNMFYIWNLLGGFTFYNFLFHTFPFIFWIFGQLSFYSMISSLISILDISSFLFSTSLLFYYTSLMIKNQTVHEKSKSIDTYNLGDWKLNVKQCLGANWYIIWLSPFISSKMLGNGIDFPNKRQYQLESSKCK